MNELKTKNDTPAEEARPKQSRWRRLPKGGRAAVVALGIVVLLAVTAFLYVNGKLDLLRYNDGSVSEMGASRMAMSVTAFYNDLRFTQFVDFPTAA